MKNSSYVRDITLLFAFLALSNAIGSAQSVTAYNGSAANLSTGINYLIYFDDSLTTQVVPTLGNENALAMKFIVTADSGSNVVVSFTLPTLLAGSSQSVACTFTSTAGAFLEEANRRWNPNIPEIISIGASGLATIDLGIIVTIPDSADTGLFSGTVIIHADLAPSQAIESLFSLDSAQYQIGVTNMATDVTNDGGNISIEYLLSQNFPNPFNPSTTITFGLPSKSFVSLKVFDGLGREVSNLVSEELPAGTYSREWAGTYLSSGVYFYRLQAGSFIEIKKLILLR